MEMTSPPWRASTGAGQSSQPALHMYDSQEQLQQMQQMQQMQQWHQMQQWQHHRKHHHQQWQQGDYYQGSAPAQLQQYQQGQPAYIHSSLMHKQPMGSGLGQQQQQQQPYQVQHQQGALPQLPTASTRSTSAASSSRPTTSSCAAGSSSTRSRRGSKAGAMGMTATGSAPFFEEIAAVQEEPHQEDSAIKTPRGLFLEDDFTVQSKVLGSGLSGEVKEALCRRTGGSFAVKSFTIKTMAHRHVANLEREVEVLSSIRHPHIVHLEAVYDAGDQVFLVMEKLNGGEVFEHLLKSGRFNEKRTARITLQVLKAVCWMHTRRIVHRDLKPENIMFVDRFSDTIKLIDFGFAAFLDPGQPLTQLCGTIQYIAPEVLKRGCYDEKADIWSLGSVVYTLLTNKVMYAGDETEIKRKNKNGTIDWSRSFKVLSEECQEYILKLLVVEASQRPCAQACMSWPWLHIYAADMYDDAWTEVSNDVRSLARKCGVPVTYAPLVSSYYSREELEGPETSTEEEEQSAKAKRRRERAQQLKYYETPLPNRPSSLPILPSNVDLSLIRDAPRFKMHRRLVDGAPPPLKRPGGA